MTILLEHGRMQDLTLPYPNLLYSTAALSSTLLHYPMLGVLRENVPILTWHNVQISDISDI